MAAVGVAEAVAEGVVGAAFDDAASAQAALDLLFRNGAAGRADEMRRLRALIRAGYTRVDDLFREMTPAEREAFGPPIDPHHRPARGWAA